MAFPEKYVKMFCYDHKRSFLKFRKFIWQRAFNLPSVGIDDRRQRRIQMEEEKLKERSIKYHNGG
jgi:hypothetical protein